MGLLLNLTQWSELAIILTNEGSNIVSKLFISLFLRSDWEMRVYQRVTSTVKFLVVLLISYVVFEE